MSKRSTPDFAQATLASIVLSLSFASQAAESDAPSTVTLSEVLVTGEQSGPGLWKVSKGDHVLWIFGSYAPLPKKLTWRSGEVEAILASSQELITPVDVKPKVGFWGGLSMLPSLIGMRNSPDKAKLKDVVPADQYDRWLVQKQKYLGNDGGIEKFRPSFAAAELYSEAVDEWGYRKPDFPPSDELRDQIEKLAKKHKVRVNNLELPFEVEHPRAWIKDVKAMRIDDLACFKQTLGVVEGNRDLLRTRVNAWATGNIEALRASFGDAPRDACADVFLAFLNSDAGRKRGFDAIVPKVVNIWVAAAEAALARNTTTFAILSIDDIYWKEGYVAKLREKGYTVEDP